MTTLRQDVPTETRRVLKFSEEWCVVLYSRYAHEEQGCVITFDPSEIASGEVEGDYGINLG